MGGIDHVDGTRRSLGTAGQVKGEGGTGATRDVADGPAYSLAVCRELRMY